ncbi:hypothetical protein D915_001962 [Fasciola hepatica]|uniref:Uncharacterized protein n=1 Tax=Fasciola hepatica TaxID=6192 RepID=A0A4E0RL65_FASHE|nr:hypothetical protein D915_001962 [Fasciola hepatica]
MKNQLCGIFVLLSLLLLWSEVCSGNPNEADKRASFSYFKRSPADSETEDPSEETKRGSFMFRRHFPSKWTNKRGSLLFYKRGREPYESKLIRVPYEYRDLPEDGTEHVGPFEYQKRASFSF